MSRTARISVVALAASLVAAAVVVWLSSSQHTPGPATSASTSTPTSAASASTASPLPGTGGAPARVDGGTYLVSDPFPVSLTVAIPAGWWVELAGPYAAFVGSSASDGGAELALSLDPSLRHAVHRRRPARTAARTDRRRPRLGPGLTSHVRDVGSLGRDR
jgi:hypothetical protein